MDPIWPSIAITQFSILLLGYLLNDTVVLKSSFPPLKRTCVCVSIAVQNACCFVTTLHLWQSKGKTQACRVWIQIAMFRLDKQQQ